MNNKSNKVKTLYNRYGEYDPGREDDPTKWAGKCDNCGEWIKSGEPTKGISMHKIAHRFCESNKDIVGGGSSKHSDDFEPELPLPIPSLWRTMFATHSKKCGHTHLYMIEPDRTLGYRLVEHEESNGMTVDALVVDEHVRSYNVPANQTPKSKPNHSIGG